MGLRSSKLSSATKSAPLLPVLGCGSYDVGCADLMVTGETESDSVFVRIFYPTGLKVDIESSQSMEKYDYPTWLPRYEYMDGLAEYREISKRKVRFYIDWIVGERRVPAAWHAPLITDKKPNVPNSRSEDNLQNGHTDHNQNGVKNSASDNLLGSSVVPEKFPVLVFSHGLSGNRLFYSTVCASLASYGFVVAAIEHRDRSSSWTFTCEYNPETSHVSEKPITMLQLGDGEREFKIRNQQLHKRVGECVRTLNLLEELNLGLCGPVEKNPKGSKIVLGQNYDWKQFKDRLDISNAAVVGHSFGGSTAIATAAFSTDFKCAVVLDGWLYPLERDLYPRTSSPMLLLNAGKWQWPDNIKRMAKLDRTSSEKLIFTFKDIVHQSFSDFTHLMPGYVGRKFNVQGDMDPTYCGEAILEFAVTFLRRIFSGHSSAEESMRKILERYADHVVEGINMELEDDEPPPKLEESVEKPLKVEISVTEELTSNI